jgi:hypothetical protein
VSLSGEVWGKAFTVYLVPDLLVSRSIVSLTGHHRAHFLHTETHYNGGFVSGDGVPTVSQLFYSRRLFCQRISAHKWHT